MTREEAIRVLTLARDDWETSHCSPMYRKEAFQMAIKSLSEDHIADADKKVSSSCGQENDMVSRQAAIDAIKKSRFLVDAMEKVIKLPSAQPEPLTDKEQRIFLAAMSREEKVCKQVDEECRDCREPYEDSLVWTCHEITRKVKGALWT